MPTDFLFTSESVTEGHPDKIADQISDGVLDAMLAQDRRSRVACETLLTTGMVVVAGEITSRAVVDISEIAREVIRDIGYDHSEKGFDAATCGVAVAVHKQSPDISQGVSEGEGLYKEQGAGDQGMMFGYACNQTKSLMPAPITYAHALCRLLSEKRRSGKLPFLRPDGKSQVTCEYRDGKLARIDTVVVSSQHSPDVSQKRLREGILEEVVKPAFPAELLDRKTKYFVNPTGRFVLGGPAADTGVTGRKIIVDTYGGWGRHGGGAFSGKDPSKVDRSAAYVARYVAKNVVAAKLAEKCEVQVAYAIGVARPVSVHVDTFGTAKAPEAEIERAILEVFDLRPAAIIEQLDLLRPIYRKTAAFGHFGRSEKEFTWERTNRARELRDACLS